MKTAERTRKDICGLRRGQQTEKTRKAKRWMQSPHIPNILNPVSLILQKGQKVEVQEVEEKNWEKFEEDKHFDSTPHPQPRQIMTVVWTGVGARDGAAWKKKRFPDICVQRLQIPKSCAIRHQRGQFSFSSRQD